MAEARDLIRGEFLCAFCARSNAVLIDRVAGARQTFREECEHCHQPNRVEVEFVPGVATPRTRSHVD